MMFDSHCHIHKLNNIEKNIKDALKIGVTGALAPTVSITDFKELIKKLKRIENIFIPSKNNGLKNDFFKNNHFLFFVFPSLGLHPEEVVTHFLSHEGLILEAKLYEYLHSFQYLLCEHKDSIWCLGEVGFDVSKEVLSKALIPKEFKEQAIKLQEKVFDYCVSLAAQYDLPIAVHSRECWPQTLKKLKEVRKKYNIRIMIHSLSCPVSDLKILQELNIYASVGRLLINPKAKKAKEIASFYPLNKILTETDAPYGTVIDKNNEKIENNLSTLVHVQKILASYRTESILKDNLQKNFFEFLRNNFND